MQFGTVSCDGPGRRDRHFMGTSTPWNRGDGHHCQPTGPGGRPVCWAERVASFLDVQRGVRLVRCSCSPTDMMYPNHLFIYANEQSSLLASCLVPLCVRTAGAVQSSQAMEHIAVWSFVPLQVHAQIQLCRLNNDMPRGACSWFPRSHIYPLQMTSSSDAVTLTSDHPRLDLHSYRMRMF